MRIGLVSLGCPKNLVDSEVMLGLAQAAGHEVTPDASSADVLIVNTCAFIESAKQESIDTILELAQHKQTGQCSRLIVTGCLAERYRDELTKNLPEVDVVIGTGELPQIVGAIEAVPRAQVSAPVTFHRSRHGLIGTRDVTGGAGLDGVPSAAAALGCLSGRPDDRAEARYHRGASERRIAARHRPHAAERDLPTYIYDATTPRLLTTPRHFAYVKVAEGCDYNCAFCVIPTLRGPYRSRSEASIVEEARGLADRGVRELILISQDTTFYGVDRHERGALARLLRSLNQVDGLEWIRLLYLYPTTVTADTLDAMAECDKVCQYIDLPLQHASDAVLKRMRRPGNRRTYEHLLDMMRARLPRLTLRTTVIVGFPGETDADFRDLMDFVQQTEFDHLGVFTYSHEEGTAAQALPDDVSPALKRRRRDALMAIQREIVERKQRQRIGSRVRLLVEGPSPDHDLVWHGRLEGQAPEIDGVAYLTDCDPSKLASGAFLDAVIVDAQGYDLVVRPFADLLPS